MKYLNTLITGMGSYVPSKVVKNDSFAQQDFYSEKLEKLENPVAEIISKFNEITGIKERRYIQKNQLVSDISAIAAQRAIKDANIDLETIDQIICAHNFGDISSGSTQTDILPSIASKVKHILKSKNPSCVAYDILFGCPGWVQGMIQANAYAKSGLGKRFLVIGAEALSRVVDPYDRDTMIYSDGAGAAIVEAVEEKEQRGILSSSMQTDTLDEAYFLYMGKSNKPGFEPNTKYMKMFGRKIYEYAISNVPAAMKLALDKTEYGISDVKKIIIHQANEKMDEAIVKRFYRLYKEKMPEKIMPMTIELLGNSSVATIPTLYDKLLRNEYPEHEINDGDVLIFASVGAGMNINSFVYKK